MKYFYLFLFFLSGLAETEAQKKYLGSSNIFAFKLKLQDNFELGLDSKIRANRFYHNFYYYEYKLSLAYKFGKYFNFMLGAGQYNSYAHQGNFSNLTKQEYRIIEQLTIKSALHRASFENRFRLEQRFHNTQLRNYFRYLMGLKIPLNNKKIEAKIVYALASNEFTFTFDKSPHFERNRAALGLGYALNSLLLLELSYYFQHDFKLEQNTNLHYLQLSMYFNFALPKKAG